MGTYVTVQMYLLTPQRGEFDKLVVFTFSEAHPMLLFIEKSAIGVGFIQMLFVVSSLPHKLFPPPFKFTL